MSIELKERPAPTASAVQTARQAAPVQRKAAKNRMPQKQAMNLYYKPDRTTKPATVALYTLFVLVCLLGLGKLLIYDIWVQTAEARAQLEAVQAQLNGYMAELADYNEVRERYQRYAATDEERVLIDRMEVLALLDEAVGATAQIDTIAISGSVVQIQFSGVTLAQTAQIVRALEGSPIVAGITVNTASTADGGVPIVPADDSALVRANALIQLQKEVAEE